MMPEMMCSFHLVCHRKLKTCAWMEWLRQSFQISFQRAPSLVGTVKLLVFCSSTLSYTFSLKCCSLWKRIVSSSPIDEKRRSAITSSSQVDDDRDFFAVTSSSQFDDLDFAFFVKEWIAICFFSAPSFIYLQTILFFNWTDNAL